MSPQKASLYTSFMVCSMLLLTSCPPDIPSNTDPQAGTGDETCDFGIKLFNESFAGRVIDEIEEVKERYGSLSSEITDLYPAARDAWNQAVTQIARTYPAEGYLDHLGAFNGSYDNWRNENLQDFDRFFLALTEARIGRYPSESKDMSKIAGWQERANIRKRVEAHFRLALRNNCRSVRSQVVKERLKPSLLPESLEGIN